MARYDTIIFLVLLRPAPLPPFLPDAHYGCCQVTNSAFNPLPKEGTETPERGKGALLLPDGGGTASKFFAYREKAAVAKRKSNVCLLSLSKPAVVCDRRGFFSHSCRCHHLHIHEVFSLHTREEETFACKYKMRNNSAPICHRRRDTSFCQTGEKEMHRRQKIEGVTQWRTE